jgi:hypothetical protein
VIDAGHFGDVVDVVNEHGEAADAGCGRRTALELVDFGVGDFLAFRLGLGLEIGDGLVDFRLLALRRRDKPGR